MRSSDGRSAQPLVLRRVELPEALVAGWADWRVAAEFHYRTKDVAYRGQSPGDVQSAEEGPPPLKPARGGAEVDLPVRDPEIGLGAVLRARRTWRAFGPDPVSVADVAALCQMTFGIQHWVVQPGVQRQALKTSPSGGARHSVEAYVVALRVEGLEPRVYHYAPDRHALEEAGSIPANGLEDLLPAQPWFWGAAAAFFLTSRFGRVRARYPHPRAYRTILIELGHLGQTFCLLATEMGLAPFTTMALADSRIDRLLGVDGVEESVLYALGVGTRPADHGPIAPRGDPMPSLVPPTYLTEAEEGR